MSQNEPILDEQATLERQHAPSQAAAPKGTDARRRTARCHMLIGAACIIGSTVAVAVPSLMSVIKGHYLIYWGIVICGIVEVCRGVLGSWEAAPSVMRRPAPSSVTMAGSSPQGISTARRVVRGICLVAAFFSAVFSAMGLLASVGIFDDVVPAGRISAVVGDTKTRLRLRLDSGQEALFPKQVLWQQPQPIELKVGDRVEKRRETFAYLINDRPVADFTWVVRNWLAPPHTICLLLVYVVLGTWFTLRYGCTPLGQFACRPLRGLLSLVGLWLALVVVLMIIYGLILLCLFGVGRAIFK